MKGERQSSQNILALPLKNSSTFIKDLSRQPKPVMAITKQIRARKTREASDRSSDHFKTHTPATAKAMPMRVVRGFLSTRSVTFFMVVIK